MAKSQLALDNEIREKVMKELLEVLGEREDLCVVGSNQIAFPTTDSENNDKWVILTAKVPKEEYDGYDARDMYKEKLEEKKIKEAERKAKNEAKAKKDAERRAKLKEQKGE